MDVFMSDVSQLLNMFIKDECLYSSYSHTPHFSMIYMYTVWHHRLSLSTHNPNRGSYMYLVRMYKEFYS